MPVSPHRFIPFRDLAIERIKRFVNCLFIGQLIKWFAQLCQFHQVPQTLKRLLPIIALQAFDRLKNLSGGPLLSV